MSMRSCRLPPALVCDVRSCTGAGPARHPARLPPSCGPAGRFVLPARGIRSANGRVPGRSVGGTGQGVVFGCAVRFASASRNRGCDSGTLMLGWPNPQRVNGTSFSLVASAGSG
jgi:hypothetical protein